MLYLCATPIGNLEDITLRVLRILREADLIAAEDTRRTRKLLSHYDIHTPVTSYHEHNRRQRGEYLLGELLAGKKIALVSDAGTPGISDPGEDLVKLAVSRGVPVVPLPGPSALVAALVASGLPAGRFVFEGFLPHARGERRRRIEELRLESRTIIFYESPHRLKATLEQLLEGLGDRPVALARELTKKYEEIWRGSLAGAVTCFTEKPPRGEFCLVLGGMPAGDREQPLQKNEEWHGLTLEEQVSRLEAGGLPPKEAMREVAKLRGVSRREIYNSLLKSRDTK